MLKYNTLSPSNRVDTDDTTYCPMGECAGCETMPAR